MPIVARSHTVIARDQFGRFTAEIERASRRTVERSVERGARISRRMAPKGRNRHRYADRPGYVPLSQSIRTHVSFGGTRGYWYSIAPHAEYVEEGTAAHIIQGRLRFYWKGGWFVWNDPRYGPVGSGKPYENWTHAGGAWVYHPGTNAQPFLRPAFERMRTETPLIAKEEFARRLI